MMNGKQRFILVRLVLVCLGLLCLNAGSIHAQDWRVTYEANGSDVNGAESAPWPTNPIPGSEGLVWFGRFGGYYAKSSGSVTAVITWVGSGTPPSKIVVVESAYAHAHTFENTLNDFPGTASNGLGHPAIRTPQPWYSGQDEWVISSGSKPPRVVEVPAGETVIRLSAVQLSAEGDHPTGGPMETLVGYKAEVAMPFVSGTNCDYRFHLPGDFTGTLQNITIKVNETTLHSGTSIGDGTPESPRRVTYSSTYHPDGTVLRFETTATNTENKEFKEEDLYIVYNKYAVAFKADNDEAISEFIPGYLRAMKHKAILDDQNTSVWMYTKDNFKKACHEATAIHFNLHGTTTFLQPSATDPHDPGKITSSEISTEVGNRSGRPGINVVFAQSCSTCANGSTVMANAFGIIDSSIDRAYVGFDRDSARGWAPYEEFWNLLEQGKTVGVAVAAAQDLYDNEPGAQIYPATLKVVGDGSTTLYSLYPTKQKTPWWKVN